MKFLFCGRQLRHEILCLNLVGYSMKILTKMMYTIFWSLHSIYSRNFFFRFLWFYKFLYCFYEILETYVFSGSNGAMLIVKFHVAIINSSELCFLDNSNKTDCVNLNLLLFLSLIVLFFFPFGDRLGQGRRTILRWVIQLHKYKYSPYKLNWFDGWGLIIWSRSKHLWWTKERDTSKGNWRIVYFFYRF